MKSRQYSEMMSNKDSRHLLLALVPGISLKATLCLSIRCKLTRCSSAHTIYCSAAFPSLSLILHFHSSFISLDINLTCIHCSILHETTCSTCTHDMALARCSLLYTSHVDPGSILSINKTVEHCVIECREESVCAPRVESERKAASRNGKLSDEFQLSILSTSCIFN